jgi:hypothetical protein
MKTTKLLFMITMIMAMFISCQNQTPKETKRKFSEKETPQFGKPIIGYLTVPLDYNHDTQIDEYYKNYKNDYDQGWTKMQSKDYAKASNKLVPGKKYRIAFYPVIFPYKSYSRESLAFLNKQNALLVNAQGLTLVCQQAKEIIPKDVVIYSLDKEESLLRGTLDYEIPTVAYRSGDNLLFLASRSFSFGGQEKGDYLLCFFEI